MKASLIPHIDEAMELFGITSKAAKAAFMATLNVESGKGVFLKEIWGNTIWQRKYEGHKGLGNIHPGDGKRYLGRGLIQVTGRQNYRKVTNTLRSCGIECPDFEANPEALEEPRWAALSAGAWWHNNKMNEIAHDPKAVRRRVNGPGMLHYSEFRADYDRMMA